MASRFHHSQTSLLHTSTTKGRENQPSAQSSQHISIAKNGPSNETSSSAQNNNEFAKRSDETAGNILPVKAISIADVICGRGRHIMNRHGNLNFHLLVNRYRQTYLTSTRRDKAAITRHIVQEIKSTGARFLRRFDEENNSRSRPAIDDDIRWVEVDDKAAYKKVSHALRLRKSEHGRNFLKSVKIQEKMNNSNVLATTAQAVAPILPPSEVAGVASSVQPNHPGNGSSHLCSSSLDLLMGWPIRCPPPPEVQYQPPVAVHAPPQQQQQLDYALAQQQMGGFPIRCPLPPEVQHQPPVAVHAPPPQQQLDYTLAQQQMGGWPIRCPSPPEVQYQPPVAVHAPPQQQQLDYALAQQQMGGLPIRCPPPPEVQYQPPVAAHAPQQHQQLDYALAQQQITQPLQVMLPWHNVNGYGNNVMLDPRIVANAFALTLAAMTQTTNQHSIIRSCPGVDGSIMGSSHQQHQVISSSSSSLGRDNNNNNIIMEEMRRRLR